MLPKEFQEIDRFLVIFGDEYNKQNPTRFKNKDTPYYATLAILNLNVTIYNQNVTGKDRPSRE
jgi:Sec7-like guanine-nucleotide exchange factor